jgi:hypothetical protein
MLSRGGMIWLLAHSLPLSPVRLHTGKRDNLLSSERGEGGGRGAESYDRKKAWSSMNYLILYDTMYVRTEKATYVYILCMHISVHCVVYCALYIFTIYYMPAIVKVTNDNYFSPKIRPFLL